MTVGIAITLEDGVLLVADGRRSRPLVNGAPPEDNVNKIYQIDSKIAAITFGVEQGTDVALDHLRSNLSGDLSPQQLCVLVENSVDFGWANLLSRLGADVDRRHRTIRVGLVVGGLAAALPFVSGALKHVDNGNSIVEVGPYKSIVLGGEEQNATREFDSRSSRAVQQFASIPGGGLMNSLVNGLLSSAEETIRLVAENNPEVGGTIRYAVIRRDFPYTTGAL
jgi:20S proteasome alpha/beta subunit